jgi:hypothetical protein
MVGTLAPAPLCPWNYQECPAAYGGGCCHYSQRCARRGCEEVRHPELENIKPESSPDQEAWNAEAPNIVDNDIPAPSMQTVLRGGNPINGPQNLPTDTPRGFRGWREDDIPLSQRMGLIPTKTTVKFGELAATSYATGLILENGTLRMGFHWEWTILSLGALAAVMFAL